MWLVVGLGNPGQKYQYTRHNVGFLAIEHFAKSLSIPPPSKKEHSALVTKFKLGGQDIILAQPQTFMNLSGDSVQKIMAYYKIPVENLLVLHDEVDLPFGALKMQKSRGHGGNNGIRDIHQKLGTNNYSRIRIGVGRPANPKQDVASFVLQNFTPQEMGDLAECLDLCGDGIEEWVHHGFEKAATLINSQSNQKGKG